MTVYALWHGGSSYGWGDENDLERFDSIKAAGEALLARERNGGYYMHDFDYVNREPDAVMTPVVEDSRMHVYLALDQDDDGRFLLHGNGPDRILSIGPRGGLRIENG
jgi:hypothetical protein